MYTPTLEDKLMADPLVWKVQGMTCGGCAANVERVAGTVPGVKKVKAHHMTGCVDLEVEDSVDHALLKRRIEQAGYEVVGA